MFFFEIMAIPKEKMLSLQKNSRNRVKKRKELERNQVKIEKISNNQITKIERKIRNYEQR